MLVLVQQTEVDVGLLLISTRLGRVLAGSEISHPIFGRVALLRTSARKRARNCGSRVPWPARLGGSKSYWYRQQGCSTPCCLKRGTGPHSSFRSLKPQTLLPKPTPPNKKQRWSLWTPKPYARTSKLRRGWAPEPR